MCDASESESSAISLFNFDSFLVALSTDEEDDRFVYQLALACDSHLS